MLMYFCKGRCRFMQLASCFPQQCVICFFGVIASICKELLEIISFELIKFGTIMCQKRRFKNIFELDFEFSNPI